MGRQSDERDVEKHERSASFDDESASAPSDHTDPKLEARVNRKLDLYILPWLFLLWLLAYIDRANIGNARIDGLSKDLGLDKGNKFNISLAVFYVPYILVDVPSNWVLKYFRAGYYLPFLLASWGLVSLCTGFVKTYESLLAVRFFLGLCEGGLLGGIIIYLAMFYPRKQIMTRIGFFYCAAPLSGAFGGLLAAGLAQIKTKAYPTGWPFIFFVEGAITIVVGLLACLFLPHTPAQAKFLDEKERESLIVRLNADANGSNAASSVDQEHFNWRWVRMALLNVNTALLSWTFFAIITPIYSFSLFLPTIIQDLGYKAINAQLFTVPPNAVAVVTVLIATYFSGRTGHRGAFMLAGLVITLVGYILLLVPEKKGMHTQYAGTFLVAAGVFPCSPLVMGWLANNLAPHYVRATGTGFQIMIANLAAFVATFTYRTQDSPRYIIGHSINVGMIGLAFILVVSAMLYQAWENKKRDRGERDDRLTTEDESLLGYRHPKFRYTL